MKASKENNRMPFIVFEGLDGSGLTTQAHILRERLEKVGYEVYLTKEPTDGLIGSIIRGYLRGEVILNKTFDKVALALLFAADRAIHTNKIINLLESGVIVISDRYKLSSFAYQSVELDLDWIMEINKNTIDPDITFILDVPPSIALRRIKRSRFHLELYEDIKILEKVRENYLKLAKEIPNTFIINANRPIKVVSEEIFKILKNIDILDGLNEYNSINQLDIVEG